MVATFFVYKDSQLLRPDTFKPISPPIVLIETTVAKLINNENKWDVAKLNQHFMHDDTKVILKIPLP